MTASALGGEKNPIARIVALNAQLVEVAPEMTGHSEAVALHALHGGEDLVAVRAGDRPAGEELADRRSPRGCRVEAPPPPRRCRPSHVVKTRLLDVDDDRRSAVADRERSLNARARMQHNARVGQEPRAGDENRTRVLSLGKAPSRARRPERFADALVRCVHQCPIVPVESHQFHPVLARNVARRGQPAAHQLDLRCARAAVRGTIAIVTEPSAPNALFCAACLRGGKTRYAWSITGGEAVCIRHAVISFEIEDDMYEHLLFEDLYQGLRQLGYDDTY